MGEKGEELVFVDKSIQVFRRQEAANSTSEESVAGTYSLLYSCDAPEEMNKKSFNTHSCPSKGKFIYFTDEKNKFTVLNLGKSENSYFKNESEIYKSKETDIAYMECSGDGSTII